MRRAVPSGAAFALAAVLAATPLGGPARAAAPAPPAPVPITSGWELAMDPADQGRATGRPTGAGADWHPTTVPGVLDGDPADEAFHGTIGWYRVTFPGPAAPAGFGWDLRFDSVRRIADVWLNGRPLGTHTDPYVPFELEAAGLRPGRPNTLVVRVDNRKGPEPREGWWNWGGIVRPVALVPRGRVMLDTPGLLYRGGGRETFDGWLVNRSSQSLDPRVTVNLRAPSGRVTRVERAAGPLAPGERRRLRFDFPVAEPELWAPDKPQLYTSTIETRVGDRVEQRDSRRVGLRTVGVAGGRLVVNG